MERRAEKQRTACQRNAAAGAAPACDKKQLDQQRNAVVPLAAPVKLIGMTARTSSAHGIAPRREGRKCSKDRNCREKANYPTREGHILI
jgi:hypothetical protein